MFATLLTLERQHGAGVQRIETVRPERHATDADVERQTIITTVGGIATCGIKWLKMYPAIDGSTRMAAAVFRMAGIHDKTRSIRLTCDGFSC